MIDFLGKSIIDLILFSGIEGFIFCLFFEKIGNSRRFKWYEWLILSLGNCLISQIFPPCIYQIFCIIWMIYLFIMINKYNIIYSIKIVISSFIFILITEIPYNIILEGFNIIDLFDINNGIKLSLLLLIIRIIEIILIIIGGNKMKILIGGVTRK